MVDLVNYTESPIINHIRDSSKSIKSDDYGFEFDSSYIMSSNVESHFMADKFELLVLSNIFPNSSRINDYILFSVDINITIYSFEYSMLKMLCQRYLECAKMVKYHIIDDALTETIWEIIYDKLYAGETLGFIQNRLNYKIEPWLDEFLRNLNDKSYIYIHGEDDFDPTRPLLSNLILVYSWKQLKSIIESYGKNHCPLTTEVWKKYHPLLYIEEEPVEIINIHNRYFSSIDIQDIFADQ